MSDLIVFQQESAAELFKKEEGIQPLLDKIAEEVEKFVPDMTSKKGRDEIKSMARKVSSTKSAIEKFGKALVEDQKRAIKIVDTERKRSKDFLDELRDKVRKPLTDWENKEKERLEKYTTLIAKMNDLALTVSTDWSNEELDNAFLFLKETVVDESWSEFQDAGKMANEAAVARVSEITLLKKKQDEEKAELEKLRKEKEQREREEREAVIAKEAAAKAKREAEQEAEAKLRAQQERAEREKRDALDKERRESEQRLAYERKKQALKEKEEQEAKEREEARAADVEHRKEINNGILTSLMKIGADEPLAKNIIAGIVKGAVPNVKVTY